MATSIAEYYTNELDDWKDSIHLNLERISESEERLNEILHFNTIPNLAANVERYLNELFLARQNLLDLDNQVTSLEKKLYNKEAPVRDELVTDELKKLQKSLRESVYKAEKEFLELKYVIDAFIAQVVNAQIKKTDTNHK